MTEIPASTSASPLELIAMRVSHNPVRPCEELRGQLFWEVTVHYKQFPLQEPYNINLQLSDAQHQVPITPDFSLTDWQAGDRFLTNFRLPIPCRMLDTQAPISITLHDPDIITPLATWRGVEVQIHLGREFTPPDTIALFDVNVESDLATLIGYRL
jgi:hypothetical protein